MDQQDVHAVYLFIAELTGSFVPGSGNEKDKANCGKEDYLSNHLPVLDLSDEEDRKDLHEKMWLERLYRELDSYFDIPAGSKADRLTAVNSGRFKDNYKWTVPVECDASALT